MGDFKKNPKKPFEIKVPNKIRKRIAMHERDKPDIHPRAFPLRIVPPKKRDSLWSRFTDRVKKFLK